MRELPPITGPEGAVQDKLSEDVSKLAKDLTG